MMKFVDKMTSCQFDSGKPEPSIRMEDSVGKKCLTMTTWLTLSLLKLKVKVNPKLKVKLKTLLVLQGINRLFKRNVLPNTKHFFIKFLAISMPFIVSFARKK